MVYTFYWINILFRSVESKSPIWKKTSPASRCLGTKYAFVRLKGYIKFNVTVEIKTKPAASSEWQYINAFKFSFVIQSILPWKVTFENWYKVFIFILANIKCYIFIVKSIRIQNCQTFNCCVAFTDGERRRVQLCCNIP